MHAFIFFFRYLKLIFDRHVAYALKVRPILRSMIGESCTSDWCEGYGLILHTDPMDMIHHSLNAESNVLQDYIQNIY